MTPYDTLDDDFDRELSTHLRWTLLAVAGTIDEDEPVKPVGSTSPPVIEHSTRPSRRYSRWRTRVAIASADAAVVLVSLVMVQPPGLDDQRAWAADLEVVAEIAPPAR